MAMGSAVPTGLSDKQRYALMGLSPDVPVITLSASDERSIQQEAKTFEPYLTGMTAGQLIKSEQTFQALQDYVYTEKYGDASVLASNTQGQQMLAQVAQEKALNELNNLRESLGFGTAVTATSMTQPSWMDNLLSNWKYAAGAVIVAGAVYYFAKK